MQDTDYILCFKPMTNEANDDKRAYKGPDGLWKLHQSDRIDWRLWSNTGFGRRIESELQLGKGFSTEVTDFGDSIVLKVSYHNLATGVDVAKTFSILFDDPKGAGRIMASSTKWRTYSNYSQVVSYVRGIASDLVTRSNLKA